MGSPIRIGVGTCQRHDLNGDSSMTPSMTFEGCIGVMGWFAEIVALCISRTRTRRFNLFLLLRLLRLLIA
jgi:hypothetical protein